MEEYLLGELAQVHPITRALSGTPPRLEARIFARPLAKAKQVAERDINNTNNINQQQLRVQQHSTRSKDLLADGKAPQKSRFFGDPVTARLD